MPRKGATITQSSAQTGEPIGSLRSEVKQALLDVLRSSDASAASKASAGRTLLEYFADDKAAAIGKRGVELTASELDAAIADIGD